MNTQQPGTLYGIGVGPGDPDLITLKAIKILQKVDVVFAAASTKNRHSQAVAIAGAHIPDTTRVELLAFPMTRDRGETHPAWQSHARTIIAALEQGRNAAFLTLGDAMTYSTFGYVLKQIQALAPHLPVETVPGITSYQAAAARLNQPLVEGEESLLILSGANGGENLRSLARQPENIVFLKAYKQVEDIIAALDEYDMTRCSTGIAHCGLPEEEIIRDIRCLRQRKPGYWTLIIAKKGLGA